MQAVVACFDETIKRLYYKLYKIGLAMKYYVNEIPDEEDRYHEIHKADCIWLPKKGKRSYLGQFYGLEACCQAVDEALKFYSKVHGCNQCCCENSSSYAINDYCAL